MSLFLHTLAMIVILTTFFVELTDIQLLTHITAWGFLFIAAIISGIRINTNIALPKDLFDDRHK